MQEIDAALVYWKVSDGRWDFRTVDALVRETGLPKDRVEAVLAAYPERFRRCFVPGKNGEVLWADARRRMKFREFLSTWQYVLKGCPQHVHPAA